MKVSELGEFGLIDRLAEMVNSTRGEQGSNLIIGIGDDTAAWQCDGAVQLATVDSLVEDVHFSLITASWEEVGWKSLAVTLEVRQSTRAHLSLYARKGSTASKPI